VHAVIEKTGIAHYFQAVHSAEREILGKPHPAVFITAAQKLGVSPEHVLVFEDSFHGVVAALAAKMQVFAIPDKEQILQARFAAATALFENMESALEFLKTQGLKGIS
jgi:beta-phosphoglucomutase-like phosphatase (HAD superfamily)